MFEVMGVAGLVLAVTNVIYSIFQYRREKATAPTVSLNRAGRPSPKPRIVAHTEEREAEIEENRHNDKRKF